MEYEIVHLPKVLWKGHNIPIAYTTEEYYDVSVAKNKSGFNVEIVKKRFDNPVSHSPEEYDFPDSLYADYWEYAYAWGVLADDMLVAAIETDQELWSNRLRITELWVSPEYQKKGIGHSLINVVKEQARRERRRAIILETQSCNVNAIDFYQHEGFTLIGFDSCCYKNNDLQRKEVRLEFGWFPPEKKHLTRDDVEIRQERKEDYHEVERMTQLAFWNKHHLGCDEHLLVHKMRESDDFIPELSRIAVKDGEIVGYIMYSKARIVDNSEVHNVLTFGPLCVKPEWQGYGVGELLLKETMSMAAKAGYPGIVIFGEPDYYPRIGFKTCDKFNITTPDGKNFDAFMGIELIEGAMKNIKGKFYESDIFEDLPKEEVEEYNKNFPLLKKMRFPDQWD